MRLRLDSHRFPCKESTMLPRSPRALLVAALAATVVASLTGCVTTNLDTLGVEHSADGQVYYLPRAEFAIEAEREITSCRLRPHRQDAARLWVNSQVTALDKVRTTLRTKVRSIYCDKELEELATQLEQQADFVDLLRGAGLAQGECGSKSQDGIKAEAQATLRFLVGRFFADPNFELSGAKALLEGARFHRVPDDIQETLSRLVAAASEIGKPDAVGFDVLLDMELRTRVEPLFLPDMNHVYTLDYAGTRRSLKKTEYEVETYENGTLKSINATLEDKTADVIRASLSGVLSIAAAATGVPLPIGNLPTPLSGTVPRLMTYERFAEELERQLTPLCNETTARLLNERKILERALGETPAEIRRLTGEVESAQKEVAQAEKALADAKAAGKTGDDLKPLEAAVAQKKAVHTAAQAALDAKKKQAAPFTSELAEVRRALTAASRLHFRPDSATTQVPLGGQARAAGQWFDPDRLEVLCRSGRLDCAGTIPRRLLAWTALYLAPGRQPATAPEATHGVVYRQPARGVLLTCSREPCLDGCGQIQATSEDLVSIGPVDVPQLGVLARLPLQNKAFQNNSLEASFASSGTLTRVKYSSNARAVAQAETFSESADSLLKFFEARRAQDTTNLDAETAEIKARTDLAAQQLALEKALKDLEAFRSGATPPEEETETPELDDAAADEGEGDDDEG